MRYWLMKSEPDEFSIDDLARAPKKSTAWFGVRNYLARNYMRDQMQPGDQVLFYHSSCEVPGIAGIAEVSKLAYPDETQFDKKSKYFDPKATRENPRWVHVDVKLVKKTRLVTLPMLRAARQQFVALGGFAPDFGQHAVIARALAGGHFQIVALEILHAPAHVEREIEHPLLVVAFCSELAYHGLS